MTLSEWKDDFKGFVNLLSMPRDDYKGIMAYIDEVPGPHWIPVTERLPEVKQKVLVQYADESMATKRCNDAGHLAWFYSNAVAWMPAPEPYKGGQND